MSPDHKVAVGKASVESRDNSLFSERSGQVYQVIDQRRRAVLTSDSGRRVVVCGRGRCSIGVVAVRRRGQVDRLFVQSG